MISFEQKKSKINTNFYNPFKKYFKIVIHYLERKRKLQLLSNQIKKTLEFNINRKSWGS